MTIKTHGRMFTDNTVGITQLDITDGTANQAIVTDGQGVMRFATVGAGGSVGSSVYIEDIRTGDGTTTTFTLSTAAPYEESILVFIDGVAQPTASFVLPSTTSLTFTPAPGNGAAIRICHLGIASSIADCSVTGAKICMGGDTVGDVLFYNGSSYQRLTIGTALQIFRTNAATTAPEWVDASQAGLPATGADGNVLTSTGSIWQSETPLGGIGGEIVSVQAFAFTTVNAQQTWTRPSGVKRIVVHLVGAGGHATGTVSGNNHCGGGGAGGYCMGIYDVTNLATATVEIGCGEDAQQHGGQPAGIAANRDSIFSGTGITTMNAGGGDVTYYLTSYLGGAGGTASGGVLNMVGEPGEEGDSGSSSADHARTGGHAGGPFGGTFGRGADGRMIAAVQDGGDGYCIVEEYSDASASLIGDSLVSTQMFDGTGATASNNSLGANTWTKPANITKIEVWCVGGGGRSFNGGSGANHAGAGGTAYTVIDVTDITTLPLVIGHGGTVATSGVESTFGHEADTHFVKIHGSSGGQGSQGTYGGGGLGLNGINNHQGQSGSDSGEGESWFGGIYGRGGNAPDTDAGGNATYGYGTPGCVFIKEYSNPSLLAGGLSGVSDEEYISLATAATTGITGVWTRPAGVTQIEVQVIGAGAGGGRNPQTAGTAKAGKGGDGGLVSRIIDVRSLATIDYYVGARGLGATSGTSGAGQNVSFGHNGTALSTGLTVTVVSGVITAITNPGAAGSGMTLAPLIFIEPDIRTVGTAAGGSGATATAIISGGAITGITVTNGGTGYVQGSVIASFGLNAIGGLGGGNANSGTPGNSPSMGIGYGNKGHCRPWNLGTEGRTPSDPTDSTHGSTIREFGVGGVGGGPTSGTPGGNGQHGGIYIRSYR